MECNVNPKLTARVLECLECYQPFVLTPSERQFYIDKRLAEPKRCPQCRLKRKLILSEGRG